MHRSPFNLGRVAPWLGLLALACNDPTDLCAPTEGRLDFFSRGDCVFTRASFFAGHEWLTHFANLRAPADGIRTAGANYNAEFCAGLDAAASDLVFVGTGSNIAGYFFALDAKTGEVLWKFNTGSGIFSSPSMYMVNGEQFVTVASGGGERGRRGGDLILSFALPPKQ